MKRSFSSALIVTFLCCTFVTFIVFSYRRKSGENYVNRTKPSPRSVIFNDDEHLRKTLRDYLKKHNSEIKKYRNTDTTMVQFLDRNRATVEDLLDFITSETRRLRPYLADNSKLMNGLDHIEKYSAGFANSLKLDADIIERNSNTLRQRNLRIRELSRKIQKTIHDNQNQDSNCVPNRTLLCNLTNVNGFASGIHDVLYCFVKAYHSNKRVILLSSKWRYSHGSNWIELGFQPLSLKPCPEVAKFPMTSKDFYVNDDRHRGFINNVPRDIADDISWLGNEPLAWWYGQFIGYILRPNENLAKAIEEAKMALKYNNPIVGLHVRRTDKIGNEAKFHSGNEYMTQITRFYDKLEMTLEERNQPDIVGQTASSKGQTNNVKRKVFVATDDPAVLGELKERFKNYTFLYQMDSAKLAKDPKTRYSNESFYEVIIDLYLLASSDYLVCTLSSGFCRLAYELANYLKPKRPLFEESILPEVKSLDVPHHYAYISPPTRVVIYSHNAAVAKGFFLSVKPGDVLEKENQYWSLKESLSGKNNNGFSRWRNKRTGEIGFLPNYKTRALYRIA